jgi:DNA end-binding protein Ku
MPPRSLWTGSVAFGLVNVPVRVYPAIKEHALHFHLVHEPDGSPIGYQKICKKEDTPVPDDEIVKAFEAKKGELVYLSDEDFEQAQVEGQRTIDITDFVAYEEIDPIYFAKTYYVGPGDGAEHVYTLLARALEDSGLVGIAKFVMRQRQHIGALRVRDGVLTMEQLYFADEVRPAAELKPTGQRVAKNELELARQIIESATTPWKPEKYKDTYRAELAKAIDAKRKGKQVHRAAKVETEEPVDLFEALRQSVEQSKKRPKQKRPSKRAA